jgi:hypothetical protein
MLRLADGGFITVEPAAAECRRSGPSVSRAMVWSVGELHLCREGEVEVGHYGEGEAAWKAER